MTEPAPVEVHSWLLSGQRRTFLVAGQGEPLLLLHGIGRDHNTWAPMIERLSRDHLVIAPDFLGHGTSDAPRSGYGLGDYAARMRDLLVLLGIDRVTVVGHSYGGGVALQFAYSFPTYTARLALIDPGGIAESVHPFLRGMTLPGAQVGIKVLTSDPVLKPISFLGGLAYRFRLPQTEDLPWALEVLGSLRDPGRRDAFVRVLRSVIDWRGQLDSVANRGYLLEKLPMLLIWGERDTVIPVAQVSQAERALPGVRLEIVEGAGHFPHEQFPDRVADVLIDFVDTTEPAVFDVQEWRQLLELGRDAGTMADVVLHPPAPRDLDHRAPAPAPPVAAAGEQGMTTGTATGSSADVVSWLTSASGGDDRLRGLAEVSARRQDVAGTAARSDLGGDPPADGVDGAPIEQFD